MMTKTEAIEGHGAYNAGAAAGSAAGSWVFDGNSTEDQARRILAGIEDGDPEVLDMEPSPLSGEWAGESVPELSAEYGLDLEDSVVAHWFEHGFSEGYWDTVTRAAQAILEV
jgi:hypothetical protein